MEDAFQGILLVCLMALVTNGIAYKVGFFRLPSYPCPPIRLSHLLSVFGIYLSYLFALPTFLQFLFLRSSSDSPLSVQSLMTMQFFIVVAMCLTLLLYIRTAKQHVFKTVFKQIESPSTRLFDFGLGMIVWFVAFPWVAIVSQICDFFLWLSFQFKGYEQVAVRYLKDNLESPIQMMIALISIVVIAPVVEEILFRGTLQQYLKKFFSIRTSIFITALIFACFHFSPTQSLGNFSLIPSLFTFACFLGYIYERQGSIYASIGLHLGFNLTSSLQILFFPET